MNKLKKLFTRTKYKIIEVEKRKLPAFDENISASVALLGDQPGFIYLMSKLKATGHVLEERLRAATHTSLSEVQSLQHGIFWCRWLETELESATKRRKPEPSSPVPFEQEAFEQAQAMIEVVG